MGWGQHNHIHTGKISGREGEILQKEVVVETVLQKWYGTTSLKAELASVRRKKPQFHWQRRTSGTRACQDIPCLPANRQEVERLPVFSKCL